MSVELQAGSDSEVNQLKVLFSALKRMEFTIYLKGHSLTLHLKTHLKLL